MNVRQLALPVYSIALNSYREALRNKVLTSLALVPFLMIGVGNLLSQLSLHEEVRVATNASFFFSTLFTVIMGIYASVTLLHTEFERRTIYTVLSKPIYRWQFLLGKFFGVGAICATVNLTLGIASAGMVLLQGGELTATFLAAWFFSLCQSLIIAALTLFFATFTGSFLSGLFAFGLFVAGQIISQIDAAIVFFRDTSPAMVPLLQAASFALPNLESLNLSHELTYAVPLPSNYVLVATWYTISYTAIILTLAVLLFNRKNFA